MGRDKIHGYPSIHRLGRCGLGVDTSRHSPSATEVKNLATWFARSSLLLPPVLPHMIACVEWVWREMDGDGEMKRM